MSGNHQDVPLRNLSSGRSMPVCKGYIGFALVWTVVASMGFSLAPAQTTALSPAAKQVLGDAQKQGYPLTATTNVTGNVSVEAALIPPKISMKVFGKSIGNNYAAIQLTISNRSSEASLIVHSIFVDYSHWLLSGYSPDPDNSCGQKSSSPEQSAQGPARKPQGNELQDWQARTCPNQIASVESRVVRGQLLDEQPWTNRNWIVRALQGAGSVATAFTFSIGSRHAIQTISAFSGEVVPGVQTFWPDSTVGQMNRISDFGFQVNKVIPKESSDIIVAFFPIDRFITPGFKEWFIKSPALFFAPYAMLLDPKSPKKFKDIIGNLTGKNPIDILKGNQNLQSLTAGACQDPNSSDEICKLTRVLERASLNSVRIIVGGTMTVNVDNVPARIDSVELKTAAGADLTSASTGEVTGVIHGSFLSGTQPVIVDADKLQITDVAAVSEGSTDKQLHFKMTLSQPIEGKITVKARKTTKDGATVDSAGYDVTLPKATAESATGTSEVTGGANQQPSEKPVTAPPASGTPPPKTIEPRKR